MPRHEKSDGDSEDADRGSERHRGGDAGGPAASRHGGCEKQAHHEERADGLEGGDHGECHQPDQRHVRPLRPQSQRLGDPRIECGDHEGSVAPDRDREGESDRGGEDDDVRRTDGQDVAEQEGRGVRGETARVRHDDHADREHRDEQQPDAGVVREPASPLQRADGGAHRDGAGSSAQQQREAEHRGQRDAREHPVADGLSEECHAADDDPRAYDAADDRDESAAHERTSEELGAEGIGEPGHGSRLYK